jgi:hypothetical protein
VVPILSLFVAVMMGLVTATSTLADNTVTQQVTGSGARSAIITDATMGAAAYSNTQSDTTVGTMTLTAIDASGTNLGWNVTVQAANFVDAVSSLSIPNSNFSLTSASAATAVLGQNVSNQNGPKVPATSPLGTLDASRKVLQANAGYGKGTYTQALGVSLLVPAGTPLGTYLSTLTVTITAGP